MSWLRVPHEHGLDKHGNDNIDWTLELCKLCKLAMLLSALNSQWWRRIRLAIVWSSYLWWSGRHLNGGSGVNSLTLMDLLDMLRHGRERTLQADITTFEPHNRFNLRPFTSIRLVYCSRLVTREVISRLTKTVSQKRDLYTFAHILRKYWPIFKILSQLHYELNLLGYHIGFYGNSFCFHQ
jgi:hypothetical protein